MKVKLHLHVVTFDGEHINAVRVVDIPYVEKDMALVGITGVSEGSDPVEHWINEIRWDAAEPDLMQVYLDDNTTGGDPGYDSEDAQYWSKDAVIARELKDWQIL
jgi:hypothetical protein